MNPKGVKPMTVKPGTMTRRQAGRLLLGAPVVAAVTTGLLRSPAALAADEAAEQAPPPADSPLGKFLAKQEPGLDGDQKDKVRKDVAGLEQALKTLRDFPLPNDVPPAGTFRAMKSRRGANRGADGARR